MTALVTGSAGGIGSAIVGKLVAEGFQVQELDLASGFDVSDPSAWEHVGSVDLACLNAGVITGDDGQLTELTDDQYRRAIGVNVDGVVFGVRRLDRVMPKGSTIVVTASLAGLTAIPDDPIYGLTKHAVVGFVRSVAPQLAERGIRIQAVCPGCTTHASPVPSLLYAAQTPSATASAESSRYPRSRRSSRNPFVVNAVSAQPGQTAWMRIPRSASWGATERTKPTTACFVRP